MYGVPLTKLFHKFPRSLRNPSIHFSTDSSRILLGTPTGIASGIIQEFPYKLCRRLLKYSSIGSFEISGILLTISPQIFLEHFDGLLQILLKEFIYRFPTICPRNSSTNFFRIDSRVALRSSSKEIQRNYFQ